MKTVMQLLVGRGNVRDVQTGGEMSEGEVSRAENDERRKRMMAVKWKKMKHKTQRTTVNDGKTRQRVSTVQGQAQYTRTQNRRLVCLESRLSAVWK